MSDRVGPTGADRFAAALPRNAHAHGQLVGQVGDARELALPRRRACAGRPVALLRDQRIDFSNPF